MNKPNPPSRPARGVTPESVGTALSRRIEGSRLTSRQIDRLEIRVDPTGLTAEALAEAIHRALTEGER
ncbi:MAG TPA: hypothetical protein VG820_02770 [Fimbriimonadaceae bacterium]|nr:hypothetical protein [Fimbriimonadaceae bacterium]